MSEAFEEAHLLNQRARELSRELAGLAKEFFDTEPYAQRTDVDRKTGEHIHKIAMTRQLPKRLTPIAADAINNLRSALDHAVVASCIALHVVRASSTYFPFAADEGQLDNAIKGRCKNVPRELIDLFRSFKPYKGGNDLLYAISTLSGSNKHLKLVSIGAAGSNAFRIDHLHVVKAKHFEVQLPRWDVSRGELVLFRSSPEAEFSGSIDFHFFVAFANADFVAGSEASAVIDRMSEEVDRIVTAITLETDRLRALAP